MRCLLLRSSFFLCLSLQKICAFKRFSRSSCSIMVKKGSKAKDASTDHPMDLSTMSEGNKLDVPVPTKEKASKVKTKASEDEEDDGGDEKKPKAKKVQTMIERDPIGRYRSLPSSGKFTKIISWNVAGLRGILKKNANVLKNLVVSEQPDILCLQEHKLQPDHAQEFIHLLSDLGYKGFWTYSVEKKGYSGTVVFVRATLSDDTAAAGAPSSTSSASSSSSPAKKSKKQASLKSFFGKAAGGDGDGDSGESDTIAVTMEPLPPTMIVENVIYDLPDKRFIGEGRIVQIETPGFYFIGTYVPNSGQKLERLDYRTNDWDVYIRDYLRDLAKTKPVIFGGDLNVAHLDLDIYNAGQPHLKKQAGTTPQERASFGVLLSSGFKDALRHFYPEARGQFTYWSQRTFARPVNNGLRLDYFICSENLFDTTTTSPSSSSSSSATGRKRSADTAITSPTVSVVDSYILHKETEGYSDHAPVVLILQET